MSTVKPHISSTFSINNIGQAVLKLSIFKDREHKEVILNPDEVYIGVAREEDVTISLGEKDSKP